MQNPLALYLNMRFTFYIHNAGSSVAITEFPHYHACCSQTPQERSMPPDAVPSSYWQEAIIKSSDNTTVCPALCLFTILANITYAVHRAPARVTNNGGPSAR